MVGWVPGWVSRWVCASVGGWLVGRLGGWGAAWVARRGRVAGGLGKGLRGQLGGWAADRVASGVAKWLAGTRWVGRSCRPGGWVVGSVAGWVAW